MLISATETGVMSVRLQPCLSTAPHRQFCRSAPIRLPCRDSSTHARFPACLLRREAGSGWMRAAPGEASDNAVVVTSRIGASGTPERRRSRRCGKTSRSNRLRGQTGQSERTWKPDKVVDLCGRRLRDCGGPLTEVRSTAADSETASDLVERNSFGPAEAYGLNPEHFAVSRLLQHVVNGRGTMKDFTIDIDSRNGELARVASALARNGVTLRAGAAVRTGPRFVARFVPSDIEATRTALDVAGVPFEEGHVVPVRLTARAGELAALLTRIANGGVGVRALYLTSTPGGGLEVAVAPTNVAGAIRALKLTG